MSQGSLHVPVVGPVAPTIFAGQINTALDAQISKNSGSSAPSNFPTTGGAATQWEDWIDTSPGGGLVDYKIFDGANWIVRASFDTANHLSMPKIGGGSSTVSASGGGTVDLGTVRSSYIKLSASSPSLPITSFGANTSLSIGEVKYIEALANGIITFHATNMILPGAADFSFSVGDTWQMLYLGSGHWKMFNFMKSAGWGHATGDIFTRQGNSAVPGAVRLNGKTIGSGSSGGTERANADTANLFILLYLSDTNLSVSGGRSGGDRTAAINDFNNNKTLTLPDDRFRVEVGMDTMGTTTSGRTGGATFSSGDGNTIGSVGGEAAHASTAKETPMLVLANGNDPISGQGTGGAVNVTGASFPASRINSGASVTFTSGSPTTVTWTSHGFLDGQPVMFNTDQGSLPTGVSANTVYYITSTGGSTFRISDSIANFLAGVFVNTSSTGSGMVGWAGHNNMPPFIVRTRYMAL